MSWEMEIDPGCGEVGDLKPATKHIGASAALLR